MTEENGEVRELPKGWVEVALSELCLDPTSEIVDGPFGSNLKASEYQDAGIPIIRLQNIDRNRFIKKNIQFVTPIKAQDLKRHSYEVGDIIVTKLGDPLGKACVIPETFQAGVIVADLVRVRINHGFISKQFLVYSINSNYIANQLKEQTKGTTRPRVNLNHIRNLQILIPPLFEQNRIVGKIEELFSDLDQGVESLKTAQKQLKVYRQTVLKWAFEGKLTEEWRKQQSTLKTGETLLAQIEDERCSNYQGKYNEPILPKSNPFQEIPEDWCLITLDQISTFLTSGSRGWAPYYSDSGSYFIRAQNINTDKLKLEEIAHVNLPEGVEGERSQVQIGDILITMTGANVTKTALVHVTLKKKAYVNQHVGLVRLIELVSRKFIYWWLVSSQHGRAQLTTAAYGAGKPGLNLTNLKEVLITLPSIEEQEQIVQEIESRLSICDQLEATIIENLQKAEALRQSILKQAFEGKLVPQDPNDEPAKKLLERIKAEKLKQQQSKKLIDNN